MTDPIMQLDAELEWLGEIADELERQVAPCPVPGYCWSPG